MGYLIHQIQSSFILRRQHFDAALAAVKRLHDDISPGLLGGKRTPYVADRDGVSGKRVAASQTLHDALREWHWLALDDAPHAIPDEDRGQWDIVELEFVGTKLGWEDALFAALAPFVEEGSFISVVGEDGRIWRWVVIGGKCFRQDGRLVYDARLGEPVRSPGDR